MLSGMGLGAGILYKQWSRTSRSWNVLEYGNHQSEMGGEGMYLKPAKELVL